MSTEELLVSIMNPNASDSEYHVEVRKADGYWFVDAIENESHYDGKPRQMRAFQFYATDLNQALSGLFRVMAEAVRS